MVSRWTPETRSVLLTLQPSVKRDKHRVAFAGSSRMAPSGRGGMTAKVAPHALQQCRTWPARSFPQRIVRPPQERQAGAVGVAVGASMAALYLRALYGQYTGVSRE